MQLRCDEHGWCRYMWISMILGFGSITSVVSISMGEITSPLQNVWFWLKNLRYRYKAADELFAYVSWIYAAFYIFIRSCFGLAVVCAAPSPQPAAAAPAFPRGGPRKHWIMRWCATDAVHNVACGHSAGIHAVAACVPGLLPLRRRGSVADVVLEDCKAPAAPVPPRIRPAAA
jgi:hypothetical protein